MSASHEENKKTYSEDLHIHNKLQNKFYNTYGKAAMMLFCYAVFLSFVYTQQESDRFIKSTVAIFEHLEVHQAKSVKNSDEF